MSRDLGLLCRSARQAFRERFHEVAAEPLLAVARGFPRTDLELV